MFFIPSPMTGHITRPLLNWLCEQCPYLSSNCVWSLLSLLSHLKWTRERRCPVAVAICTKQHIFSLVQQHPCLVVVPLLILLLYKFYPKSKTKSLLFPRSLSLSLSYACTHADTHIYLQSQTHNPHTHTQRRNKAKYSSKHQINITDGHSLLSLAFLCKYCNFFSFFLFWFTV